MQVALHSDMRPDDDAESDAERGAASNSHDAAVELRLSRDCSPSTTKVPVHYSIPAPECMYFTQVTTHSNQLAVHVLTPHAAK